MTMTRKELRDALLMPDPRELFERADAVRAAHCGPDVFLRAIIEFSNHCVRNCLYCGLRRDTADLVRYRLTEDAIVAAFAAAHARGIQTLVLQSGDDFFYTAEMLSRMIRRILTVFDRPAITVSVGERPVEDYWVLKTAGADRCLLKHETINPRLYARLHPGQELRTRLALIDALKAMGYQIGVGVIVGLPGQTVDDLVRDLRYIQSLEPDMIGIGPFIAHPQTPLADAAAGSLDLTLRMLALARIVSRNAHIPATTAIATLDPQFGQQAALAAGADVIMLNYTPADMRRHYAIYKDKASIDYAAAVAAIVACGRVASTARGDTLKARADTKEL